MEARKAGVKLSVAAPCGVGKSKALSDLRTFAGSPRAKSRGRRLSAGLHYKSGFVVGPLGGPRDGGGRGGKGKAASFRTEEKKSGHKAPRTRKAATSR